MKPLNVEISKTGKSENSIQSFQSECQKNATLIQDLIDQVRMGARLEALQVRNLSLGVQRMRVLREASGKAADEVFVSLEKLLRSKSMRSLAEETSWLNLAKAAFPIENGREAEATFKPIQKAPVLLEGLATPNNKQKGFLVLRGNAAQGDLIEWYAIDTLIQVLSKAEVVGRGLYNFKGVWVPVRPCTEMQFGFLVESDTGLQVLGVKEVLGYMNWEQAQLECSRSDSQVNGVFFRKELSNGSIQ